MKTIAVSRVKVDRSHRKEIGDLRELAKSIREVGLLHPIVLTPDHQLVAGHRRLMAFKKLKRTKIPYRIASNLQDLHLLLKAQADENTCRKAFTPSEAYRVGEAIQRAYKAKCHRGGDRRSAKARASQTAPADRDYERTRATFVAAQAVGLARRTYEKLRYVVESKNRRAIATMDRTGRIDGAFKIAKVDMQAAAIAKEKPPLPGGKYRVITIDPPWSFEGGVMSVSREGTPPYPTMSIEEITNLPVGKLALKDSVLFMWVTNTHLPHAFDIVKAWGFTYKTMLTWDKVHFGLGDYLRGQTEHCLMCVKGSPTIQLRKETTLLRAPRRAHSEKPDEFFRLVEQLCPGSKLEMFQRKPRRGWAGFGDEIQEAAA